MKGEKREVRGQGSCAPPETEVWLCNCQSINQSCSWCRAISQIKETNCRRDTVYDVGANESESL